MHLLYVQDLRQYRTLSERMGDSKDMAKRCGHKNPVKGRSHPKPQGVSHGERAVQNINLAHNIQSHVQGIINNWSTKNHTAIIGTWD